MKTMPSIFRAAVTAAVLVSLVPLATRRVVAAEATPPGAAMAAPQAMDAQAQVYASGVSEVLKLFKGNVPADIIVNFVKNSPLSFYLSADNVIALQQSGVPSQVLTAMITRNGELLQRQNQSVQQAVAATPAPSTPAPAPSYYGYPPENGDANFNNALQVRAASPAFNPGPQPSYPVYYPADYYDYGYYSYPYAYDYFPPVVLGFGFGRVGGGYSHGGFGGHGFGGGGHGGGRR